MEDFMKSFFRVVLALAASLLASQAIAQATFYENEGFAGRSFTAEAPVSSFDAFGFRNRAGSAVVRGGRWEVCDEDRYGGRCMVLRPGRYPSLASMGLNDRVSSSRALRPNATVQDSRYAPLPAPAPVAVAPQITFYEDEAFTGRSFSTARSVDNLRRSPLGGRASSAVVVGERFEVCDESRFGGRCVVLRPGRYASLAAMDLNNRIASVRDISPAARIDESRYAPLPIVGAPVASAPPATPDFRRRRDERIFEVPVSSVRAVVGPPEQRCWIERAEVAPDRGQASVPGAVLGAVIGGILGHQIGGGRGQDIATAGGAVAGGVVGANVGRTPGAPMAQDVQRCREVTSRTPAYYDVLYSFRGVEHRVQMAQPPGPTITVNERGEPRA
jgi:uncharacterized protein YcfJ